MKRPHQRCVSDFELTLTFYLQSCSVIRESVNVSESKYQQHDGCKIYRADVSFPLGANGVADE